MKIILASNSASRKALLSGAGVPFTAQGSDVDEASIKKEELAKGTGPWDIAVKLAEVKALAINAPDNALVIGGDQVLEFEGQLYDKPASLEQAGHRLYEMAGQTHYLRSGLALAQNGKIIWTHRGTASLTMRMLHQDDIDAYLDEVGERVLATVGAYELEGPGVRLFQTIEGDYFTILGLSLLPLIEELRRRGAMPW